MEVKHKLLQRQLRKVGVDPKEQSEQIHSLLKLVESAYDDFKEERDLLERSMNISSREMESANIELGAILNSFPDMLVRLGRDCTILDLKTGQQRNPFPSCKKPLGRKMSELVTSVGARELESIIALVISKNRMGSFEYNVNYGGEVAYFEVRLLPFNNDAVVGVIRNMTSIRDAENANANLQNQLQLATKMQAVGRLAGGISHDFNNILFSVMGYTQIVMRMIGEENKAHPHLQEVITASQRGKELVEQIMIFSRYKEKKEEAVNLSKITKEVESLITPRVTKNISLEFKVADELSVFTGDSTQVCQTVMNICTNAIQAMSKKGGKLTVNIEEVEATEEVPVEGGTLAPALYARVSIADEGPGMPPAIKSKVFEPFFTTKKVGEGTGLGLSVVLGVMHEHGGGLRLETEVGKGTEFILYFPINEAVESAQKIKKEKLVMGSGSIMVVDDERMLGKMISQMLGYLGYEVTTYNSSVEALEKFEEDPGCFDLILTDQTMPEISGLELTKKVLAVNPELPVILCSGYSEDVAEEDVVEAGVLIALEKPVTFEILSQEVAKAIKSGLKDKF